MVDLEVCADCIIGIEYGYVEGTDDEWPGILPAWNGWNVHNGRACPEPWRVGTIIHGTLNPRDIIPALEAECARLGVDLPDNPPTSAEMDNDGEIEIEYLNELVDVLDRECPEGFYVGAHYGDGSDLGVWPVEDDCNEFARFTCDCCGRRTDGAMYFATAWK